MNIRIALVGNPNSGKTSLFNILTGSNQYVGNWPGVTVEKKEGRLKEHDDVIITDLPGIYSLSPYTLEEVVARDYLLNERPDAILNIVDGTNLERNLYLTTQLCELGIPVVIAINMMDVVRKSGDTIDIEGLSRALSCKVVEISALKGEGIEEACEVAIECAKSGKVAPVRFFSGVVEHALAHIEEATVHDLPQSEQRWYSIKIFERDKRVIEALGIEEKLLSHIEDDIKRVELELDDDAESIITNERYNFVTGALRGVYKRKHNTMKMSVSDRIDRVVTNRWLALPIFALVMFLVYFLSIGSIGDFTVRFMTEGLFGSFSDAVADGSLPQFMSGWVSVPELIDMALVSPDGELRVAEWLYSLIQDGIIGGVGSVLGFVPQMFVLFLLLSLLEDCGYMARVAFIMDRICRKFGLSGKSFIPMLVASGCSVPAIMASRTIEQDRDRKITIMTTSFIPCGAKMPIVSMVAGAVFGESASGGALISVVAYFIGISAVIISGIILKKLKVFRGDPAPFVMELPSYHALVARNIFRATWERGWSFIKRAGTVILVASIVIWTLNSLSFTGGFHYITQESGGRSILELLGSVISWLFIPLGFGNWQSAVATILGLLAKEEVVGAFGTMAGSEAGLLEYVRDAVFMGSTASAVSFMAFNLLCAPCAGAIGAIKREMNSTNWTLFAVGYMCVYAYLSSFVLYSVIAMFEGAITPYKIIALVLSALIVGAVIFLMTRKRLYREEK